MNNDTPADPIGELVASAVQLHEIYESFIHAGFTDQQAMMMLCTIVSANVNGSS